MNELMLEYINEQGPLVQKMTAERSDIAAPFLKKFGGVKPKRIVLFGSGSSYHAGRMAKPFLEKALRAEVTVEAPSHLDNTELLAGFKDTIFFALSQGGKSSSTVLKQRELKSRGAMLAAITENDDTLIAKESGVSVPLRVGHELIGAKTKGLTATVLTLVVLALEWGRSLGTVEEAFYQKIIGDLNLAAEQIPKNIKRSEAWYLKNRDAMLPAECMTVLAEKGDCGAALEFALKLMETIYRPVAAYEFEEYLHGCQNMLSRKSSLFFLLPGKEAAKKHFLTLHFFCQSLGAQTYLISRGMHDANGTTLNLETSGNDDLAFLELLIPGQFLSASLSAYAGIDISKYRFPGFGEKFDLHTV